MKVSNRVVPAALAAVLTAGSSVALLEKLEGNILHVYADPLARGIPTYCAGKTDWKASIGKTFTSDQCKEVNKTTVLKYGTSVLACTTWSHLTPRRLVGLTMFAINVGVSGACNSQAFKAINVGNIKTGCRLIAYKPSCDPNWSYAGGKFISGLHTRRVKEMVECLDV